MKKHLCLCLLLLALCLSWPSAAQDQETEPAADEAAPVDSSTQADESPATTEDQADTAESPSSPPINRYDPNPDQWRLGDVTRFLSNFARNGELMTFEKSDSDEGNNQISGLYLPENTGKPQGGVLILHDVDQHAHWPQTVAPLREYLPDYGWNTLSLFMNQGISQPLPPVTRPKPASTEETAPDQPEQVQEPPAQNEGELADNPAEAEDQPSAPEDDIAGEDTPPTDELDSIADSLDEIPDLAAKAENQMEPEAEQEDPGEAYIKNSTDKVTAGISQLNNLGQFNLVIIAHGVNASWAAAALNEVYEQTPDAKGMTLVLVDARESQYPVYPLNSMLANLDVPMLDLITTNEEIPIQQALDRRNTMRRSQRENYQQIRIPAVRSPLKGKHNTITRRIRGWLLTNAAGEEVDIKR